MSEQSTGRAPRWTFVGAPLDCSGTDRGERRAVGALRDAGLVDRLGARDEGDVDVPVRDSRRDGATGVIGFEQIRAASGEIQASVRGVLERGELPLVVGGDCTILVGVAAAVRESFGRAGLAFLDGHVDSFDGDELPAVTYPQPGGLNWQEVEDLLRPLVASPALIGVSVADFEPDKDPDGVYARRLVDLLTA